MRFARKRQLEKGALDIAPLVDVVLLLLLFFMLTSSMVTQGGFKVDLPPTTASIPAPDSPAVVTIVASGEIFLGELAVGREGLGKELGRLRLGRIGGELVIQADREVRHGLVVEVMTRAREAGWESLAVMARPESAAAGQ